MTTSKKLWLGFGVLIALLMLISTAIVVRIRYVEQAVRSQADVSRPRSAATREIELGILRFAIALRTYAVTKDAGQRAKGQEHVEDVERHLAAYQQMASTEQQRRMGERFAKLWGEYRDLGQTLLSPDRRLTFAEGERLRQLRPLLETMADEEMLPDAVAAYESSKEETFGELHGVAGFVLVLLAGGIVIAVVTSWAVGRGIVRAERRARANSERLRLGVEATNMGVWQVDYRDDRIIWSERCREIFGLPTDVELTRSMVLERIHPEDRDLVVRAAEESMRPESGGDFAVEHRLLTPTGEVRWVSVRGRTQFGDASGRRVPVLHTGVMVDVTDRRVAEKDLHESEARFRQLADAMPQIVYVNGPDGRIEFINRQWIEYTGRERADGSDIDAVMHPDDRAAVRPKWAQAMETETPFTAELRLRRTEDGEYRWFLTRSVPIRDVDGRVVRWYGTSTDIHEQKLAQEALRISETALRTSEERYRAFIAHSTEGIWRLEFDPPIDTSLPIEEQVELAYQCGRMAECNEVMARMYGLERPEDLVGKPLDFMLPSSDPGAREYLASIIRADYRALDVDSEERDAAGNVVYFSNSLVGVVEDGLLKRAWGTQRAVTERKRRERHAAFLAEVGRELARLSAADEIMGYAGAKVAEHLDLSACTFDEIDLSKGETVVAYGWFRNDVPCLAGNVYRHADCLSPEFLKAARDRETVVCGNAQTDPCNGPFAQHALKCVAFASVPFHRDGVWRFSLNACDVVPREWRDDEIELFRDLAGRVFPRLERARAEAALRESEGQLAVELEATTRLHGLISRMLSADDLTSSLEDVLENAIATCGADFGNIQLLNPQRKALEIVVHRGFKADFLNHFRSVRVDEGSACARAMTCGARVVIEDVELDPGFEPHRKVAAAAGYRAVQSTPLKTHDGSIVGMLSTHFRRPHRVSERDQRLLDLYARHAADLIERLQYEQALKEADRRKDEFLATLAHELRNPLAPIRNGLQILKLAGDDADAAEHALTMMDRQLAQMVRLIDDLLDVSRISRGKVELQRCPVDLAAVVQTAVETSRPLIDAQGHHLTIDLPNDSLVVAADPTRLSQVFANLLNNAAKFTPRGGRIALAVRRRGDEVEIVVRDSGIGIPEEKLMSVFDLFSQVNGSLEKSHGGLGIGLTLVKSLVEMHGGTVEANSRGLGKGSEFVVQLPLAADEVPALAEDESEPSGPPAARRILIADDNTDAAVSLAEVLQLMGHEVRTAGDGLEAIVEAESFRPDVVLLDIGMPNLNGYDACRRLREFDWGREMIIVALTGWGQEEDRRRSYDAGFDHHLVKPVGARRLTKLFAELDAGLKEVASG